MKPLGRRKSHKFPGKRDYHPPKGYVNWWEKDYNEDDNKKAERQAAKREIEKVLQDIDIT